LTIVSNRLPVTVAADGSIERSSGGLVSALEGIHREDFHTIRWIGWPGRNVGSPCDHEALFARLEREHCCSPVFLDDALARDHYEGLSNASLWPLLHSMPSMFQYRAEWWDAYQRVNKQFAERVLQTSQSGDTVWVHDYHLLLLPRLLKLAKPSLRVGFFLHTPFPSSDVLRCHPNRESLLAGVLGSDLIGFHTFGYLRHFRASVLRLLGVDSEMTSVRFDGHASQLGVHPIGIDAGRFEHEMSTERFRDCCRTATRANAGKRLFIYVERLDYTKGIVRRLDAIEVCLAGLSPAERDGVRFLFVSVPTRGGVDRYRELRETVEHRVGRINGQYATLQNAPVHFMHQSVGFTELCALYALADVALVTPLIDGMNLVAKEFVACQRDAPACPAREEVGGRTGPGVLILSEFAGAAQELPNALVVNPYDVPGIAAAIRQALAMRPEERRRRMWPMRNRVFECDAASWARDFLADLAKSASVTHEPSPDRDADGIVDRLSHALAHGKRMALFLDYDGTLREIVRDPAAAAPTQEISELLDDIAALPNVELVLISGRTADDLVRFFGAPTPFSLVAEHGAEVRLPHSGDWHIRDHGLDFSWKDAVRDVLALYQRSTPGSHVEDKRTGLVWHYRQADPEFGRWKANQLVDELSIVAANNPVEIRHGRKIVEAASAHINKATAVTYILGQRDYHLILLAGDDSTDESMFRLAAHDPRMISVRVGEGETAAQCRLSTPSDLRQLLRASLLVPRVTSVAASGSGSPPPQVMRTVAMAPLHGAMG
jgi:trehalose 6-phosphate synthase/phosphatase